MSLIDFQESVREWYANKSQDFISSVYDEIDYEYHRQSAVENWFDYVDGKLLSSSRKIRSQFWNHCEEPNFSGSNLKNDINYKPLIPIRDRRVSRRFRFDPTPELQIEDIFFDLGQAENAVRSLSPCEPPQLCATETVVVKETPIIQDDENVIEEEYAGEISACAFSGWIQFYSIFGEELNENIRQFERDSSQKEIRLKLKCALMDKINFSARKKSTNLDLAKALNFFLDLFDFKSVKLNDGSELKLDNSNSAIVHYAMRTVAIQYIEQIKWDEDLMDTIVLIIVPICLKSAQFYQIFCACILNNSVFLKMSVSKILDKIISFSTAPQETAALWIQAERSIFRLFYRVQLPLKSSSSKPNGDTTIQQVKGATLLLTFVNDVLMLKKPVMCASAFVLAELFTNCSKHLFNCERKNGKDLIEIKKQWCLLSQRIYDFDWNPYFKVLSGKLHTDGLLNILKTRNDAISCSLKYSLRQFNTSPSEK